MRRTSKPTALQHHLARLVSAAMMERRVGYSKLMHLTGVTRTDARSCLKQGKRGIAIERLIIMLYQLGYEITISVKERELSEDECDYFNSTGRTASKFRPTTIPGKDEDSVFKIRLLDRHGRTQSGTVPIPLAPQKRTARNQHKDHRTLAQTTSVVDRMPHQ